MDAYINEDAEKSLIGLAMQDAIVAQEVAALPDGLFGLKQMQACQRGIMRLVKQGKNVDLVTLDAEVQCDFQDTALLMQCVQMGISPVMSRQYIAILAECAKRRELATLARKILQDVGNPGVSVAALQADCAAAAQSSTAVNDGVTMHEASLMLANSFDKKDGVTCGIADLDVMLGGFKPGQLIYIGARPGVGKTSLAICMAKYVAEHGGGVLLVSLEMNPVEIAARFMANESGVDLQKISTGKMELEDFAQISPCYQALADLPVTIEERAVTPLQIRNAAAKMKASKQGLSLIVVDYIQLMRADEKCGNRTEEVTQISRELKLMAMDLGVPLLCMTQFNRESEKGFGKSAKSEPDMSQARDSGAIEQDANVFLILHEPEEPQDANSDRWQLYHNCQANGLTWQTCRIRKNRNGATGLVHLGFDKPHMRYTCLKKD